MTKLSAQSISISLTSHTNIGKTTLVRTLLRRDVGKVLDQAHVTDQNEKFTWLETVNSERLEIWDTPGFGDSVQLLRLLQKQENPIGWLVAHVWDRFKDRPLWCNQQAVKNVRDEADVVLYLVNALESPTSAAGYIDPEMELLEWIKKPVIVVLNQIGPDRRRDEREQLEHEWQQYVQRYAVVRHTMSLDSFARCWLLEGFLLECVHDLLPLESQSTMTQLMTCWRAQNVEVFQRSMTRLADVLARAVNDNEVVQGSTTGRQADIQRAVRELNRRLEDDIRLAIQNLIEWHGLDGNAAIKIHTHLQDVTAPLESSVMEEALGRAALGGFGGAAAGTAAGAAIDAATGGMSLGLFALTGAFLGALGLVAWGKELETEETLKIKWVPKFLDTLTQNLLLRYMAVAHFGRGRGDFQADQDNPTIWLQEIQKRYGQHQHTFQQVWSTETQEQESPNSQTLKKQLSPHLETLTREILLAMYPAAGKHLLKRSGN